MNNRSRIKRKDILLLAISVSVFVLLLGACGGSTEPTLAPPTDPPAQPTDAPTQAPTDVPPPTQPPEPTVDPFFEAAKAYEGSWTGEWRNTTFGSTGPITVQITVNEDMTATYTVDLGGMVFGMIDPPETTYVGTFGPDGFFFEAAGDPIFGDITITINPDGEISAVGDLVPVEGIARLESEGTVNPEGIDVTYTVFFAGGGSAVGEVTLKKE